MVHNEATARSVEERLAALADRLPADLKIAIDWKPGDAPLPPGTISLDDAERAVASESASRYGYWPRASLPSSEAHARSACGATSATLAENPCKRDKGHTGDHSDGVYTWPAQPMCGEQKLIGAMPVLATCELERGHFGCHAGTNGQTWSAAPPLGPVPERFQRVSGFRIHSAPGFPGLRAATNVLDPPEQLPLPGMPRPVGVSADPGGIEALASELVLCGRRLGQIEQERFTRTSCRDALSVSLKAVPPDRRDAELTDTEWAAVGRLAYAHLQLIAEAPEPEPERPIQERAEALFRLLQQRERPAAAPARPTFGERLGFTLGAVVSVWQASGEIIRSARAVGMQHDELARTVRRVARQATKDRLEKAVE